MKKQINCFIVDDDQEDHEIFEMAVSETAEDVQCRFAVDGFDALKQLSDPLLRPDIIFMDMNMPGMNGIQCLAALRRFDHLRQVPVYIFSTSVAGMGESQAKLLGIEEFVEKPASIDALATFLKSRFSAVKSENPIRSLVSE